VHSSSLLHEQESPQIFGEVSRMGRPETRSALSLRVNGARTVQGILIILNRACRSRSGISPWSVIWQGGAVSAASWNLSRPGTTSSATGTRIWPPRGNNPQVCESLRGGGSRRGDRIRGVCCSGVTSGVLPFGITLERVFALAQAWMIGACPVYDTQCRCEELPEHREARQVVPHALFG